MVPKYLRVTLCFFYCAIYFLYSICKLFMSMNTAPWNYSNLYMHPTFSCPFFVSIAEYLQSISTQYPHSQILSTPFFKVHCAMQMKIVHVQIEILMWFHNSHLFLPHPSVNGKCMWLGAFHKIYMKILYSSPYLLLTIDKREYVGIFIERFNRQFCPEQRVHTQTESLPGQ